jgi:hypothetical protein
MSQFRKFYPLVKMVDKPDGTLDVYMKVTGETPDLDKEVCDYAKTKPYFIAKGERMKKATSIEGMEQSVMPMREMHALKAIGAGREMIFDDVAKTIHMLFNVVDDDAIKKFKKGVLIGASQGGDYIKPPEWPTLKIKDPVFKGCVRYVSDPGEVSAVDSPCLPDALVVSMKGQTFEHVKLDGTVSLRKFHSPALQKLPTKSFKQIWDETEQDMRSGNVKNLHIDASQVAAGVLKVNGNEYEAATEKDSEVVYGDQHWKRKGPTVDERLGKIETLLTKALQKDEFGEFNDGVVADEQQCQCPCDECQDDNCADCSHENCDCDNCQCPEALDLTSKAVKGIVPGPGLPEKPAPQVTTMEANMTKEEQEAADKKKKSAAISEKLAAAAKAVAAKGGELVEFGKDIAADAKKLGAAMDFIKMEPVKKCMMDVHDLAEVLQTLRVVTNWQAMEASEKKDADSALPASLYALLEHAVTVFRELVEEETAEILATTASGGEKGEKSMTTEELQKAASAHLKKAMEMVKAHADHLGAVSKAHMDNVSSLNKAHGAAMDGCGSVTACKALHKAHAMHMDGVHKAHHDHIVGLAKAHSDAMSDHFGKADSPAASDITTAATNEGEVTPATVGGGSQGAYPGAPQSKALTMDDLNTALAKAIADNTAALEKKHGDELESLVKALLEPETIVSDAAPAAGIGDRTDVVKTKVQQTHPVTKAGEMTDNAGQPTEVATVVSAADVIAANNGDQGALLKMARGIKADPNGVPASIMNSGAFSKRSR